MNRNGNIKCLDQVHPTSFPLSKISKVAFLHFDCSWMPAQMSEEDSGAPELPRGDEALTLVTLPLVTLDA